MTYTALLLWFPNCFCTPLQQNSWNIIFQRKNFLLSCSHMRMHYQASLWSFAFYSKIISFQVLKIWQYYFCLNITVISWKHTTLINIQALMKRRDCINEPVINFWYRCSVLVEILTHLCTLRKAISHVKKCMHPFLRNHC